jgi:molybdopterin synthase sulfur carrier subunit
MTTTMKVTLRYFASLREALGSTEIAEVAEGTTVGALRDTLIARGEPHASALRRGRALRAAVNQQMCADSLVLSDGAELAFFPPVTGG